MYPPAYDLAVRWVVLRAELSAVSHNGPSRVTIGL
jgi:hypothetical protein